MPLHCVATFIPRFQPEAGPNSYRGSEPSHGSPRATAAGSFPGALETLAFPAAALPNDRLTLREAGPVSCRLGARAASGKVFGFRSSISVRMPSRAGGSSKATRSGTRALSCITGSPSQTSGFLQQLGVRSSLACLRSVFSSPARSAWLVMVRAPRFLLVGPCAAGRRTPPARARRVPGVGTDRAQRHAAPAA